jgi:hypothetical protein
MLQSHHQNAGQNHHIKTGNRCFENVAQFRYLGMTITNQNLIKEEIKRNRLHGIISQKVEHFLLSDYYDPSYVM